MDFTDSTIPQGYTDVGYNASAAGKTRKTRYRHDTVYLQKPFIAWDGEGVTRDDNAHDYVLLANSRGLVLTNETRLDTVSIFEALLSCADEKAIHVIYGGSYDFNKWFTDFTREELSAVYSRKFVQWRDYRIGWRRGKSLYLSDGERSITIYDVVSFFQCAFVKACDSYLGERFANRDLIVENKALRSVFNVEDLPEIIRYNDAELVNLVALMDELRSRLHKVGLRPSRWDGPGAIATALLRKENVGDHRAVSPDGPAAAARHAYAGGRFEVVRFGHVDAPAYEYDINSAYPAALRSVPSLSLGRWRYCPDDPGPVPFGMYHVTLTAEHVDWSIPFPLFRRSAIGNISYPQNVTGWYWSPEVEVAREWCAITGGHLTITEAWVYDPQDDTRPFDFIDPLYLKRRALKAGGDGAHVGIKLALNSLYGKLAQQVGWERNPHTGELRIPPFHQLEWAGYVTAQARSTVLRASLSNLDAIIAYETDAVFSSEPLLVDIGPGLGQWEATTFDSLTYIQSGLYFGTLPDGTEIAKTRGVDRGSLTRKTVLHALAEPRAVDRVARARLTRFVGAGIGLSQDFDKWGTWETAPKAIQLAPQGKRTHEFGCHLCSSEMDGETLGVWHHTLCPRFSDSADHSVQFPVEWINPNARMRAAILRDERAESKESAYE